MQRLELVYSSLTRQTDQDSPTSKQASSPSAVRVLVPSAVQSPSRVVYGSLRPSREPVALYAVAEQSRGGRAHGGSASGSPRSTLEVLFCTATLNLQLPWFRLQSARCLSCS
eukprot:scaffold7180_cov64-Phaeocystis_antarctica.AAC.3